MVLDYRIRHICNVKTKQFDAKKNDWIFRHQKPQLVGWSECSQHRYHCFARLLGLQESLINDLYQVCLNKLG